MAFWSIKRGTESKGVDGSAARSLEPHLEPIQLFTSDRRIAGWMIAIEDRVTDYLNSHPVLRVCVDPASDAWESVGRDELLVVAPPPLGAPSARRVHRLKRRVRFDLGPYAVEGLAHLPPGTALGPYLQRSRQPFLALTDAVVIQGDDRNSGEWFGTVIANVEGARASSSMIDLA
jgi:hypothetical protein